MVRDGYHRFVLPLVLQARGLEVLHASAVRIPAGVVALCGASETGKSTLARALAARGHALWADDAVVLECRRSGITAVPVPFILRLLPDARSFFDGIDAAAMDGTGPVTIVPPATGVRWLIAAFLLVRTEGPTRVRRLTAAQAFPAVLDHARSFRVDDEDRRRRLVTHYLELARRVPVYRAEFRPGFDCLGEVVEEVEGAARALTGAR
jgi:hypothetical protein